jgi:transposase
MLRVRAMTAEEKEAITRLAQSRTEPARRVERARIIVRAAAGKRVPAIADELHLEANTVRRWLKRFHAQGIAGLEDEPRAGRPATYDAEMVGAVVAAALTNPQELGLPFGSWTLDRLAAYLDGTKGVAIKRSRIDDLLRAESLRWRTQETWFGKRVDPEFAKKRELSKPSTPSLRSEA